jgi:hypothetical protein
MNMFKPTEAKTPDEYIDLVQDPERKAEIIKLDKLIMKAVPSLDRFIIAGMIGYGKFHYKSKSGREGDWSMIALASQKNYISVYVCGTDGEKYVAEDYKSKLPKANIGKSCIRFKRTSDVDLDILEEVIKKGVQVMKDGKSSVYSQVSGLN